MPYTTIDKPSDYFNTLIYTGDGSSPRTITGVGFNPDWVWGRRRDDAAGHNLFDTVRGAGSDKNLQSNGNGAEGSGLPATYGYISAFATDGFTVTAGSSDNAYWNNNSATYVAWNWLASNTTASNTDGSITSTVSAHTTAGFSLATYTGTGSDANVGHSLSSAPELIITKSRSATGDWKVHTSAIDGSWDVGTLNSTAAFGNSSYTASTNSIFYVGTGAPTNASGVTYVSYLFHSVKGYSKIGSYTGNGSTDGTFVYLGFKPAWVMIKNQGSGSYTSWSIFDTTRQTFNVNAGKTLYANKSSAEGVRGNGSDSSTTIPGIDMLSNGFKCRVLNDEVNNPSNFIYMAFAENPFTTSTGIPCTAR